MPPKSAKVKSVTNKAVNTVYPQQWDPTPHLQTVQPLCQPPLPPTQHPALFPPVLNAVYIADENFDSRFQANIAATVARHTVVPPHQTVAVDTNLIFNQIDNFAVYFSVANVFLNATNDIPYSPKNDYFLKPYDQMRLKVVLINGSDSDFSLAEGTTLGNVILFPFENCNFQNNSSQC